MEPRTRRRPPAISLIVCTYNRSRVLEHMLESVRSLCVPPGLTWELVVVNNNSVDDTERVVRDYQRETSLPLLYVSEPRQGISPARNAGIIASSGDVLAFTDDDVTVHRHWLARLARTYATFDCTGVAGRIVPVWTCAKPPWLREDGPQALMKAIVSFDLGDYPVRLGTPPFGANMSFRRSAFERYGLFRTDLGRTASGLAGGEDVEFGGRLLRNGEQLVYNPRVVVYHPVDHARATKRYFERWYYAYGRTSMRLLERPTARLERLRMRGRIARSLAATLLQWTLARDPRERLRSRLAVCQDLGRLREALRPPPNGDRAIPRLPLSPSVGDEDLERAQPR